MGVKRWTEEDLNRYNQSRKKTSVAEPVPAPKKSKYNNVKVVVGSHKFDSKAEANYFKSLLTMERIGEVTGIQLQVRFKLSVCFYVADFVYYSIRDKEWVVADAKGLLTQVYRLKKKLMLSELGISIKEIKT